MASTLRLVLLTEGDPSKLTGGHLYQQRLVQAAPAQKIALKILSLPQRAFLPSLLIPPDLREYVVDADALLVDSLVASRIARSGPRLARGRALIAIVHQQPGGADQGPLRTALQTRLDLALYRRCRLVIASSQFLAGELGRAGIREITVIPPGRDAAAQPSGPTGLDVRQGRQAALICVSNWTRNKSIELLLEAVAHLDATMATLHLVGSPEADPQYARRVRARIARDDLRDRVTVHGALPPDEVAALLTAGDIFVHPSRHESYGSAISEAMAAGLPVVAFRVDNVPMLVRDGMDGILLSYGDLVGLAAALAVLIRDTDRRRRYGEAARASALTRPTWAETTEQVFTAIRHAVTSGD